MNEVVIFDNYDVRFFDGDLTDRETVANLIAAVQPDKLLDGESAKEVLFSWSLVDEFNLAERLFEVLIAINGDGEVQDFMCELIRKVFMAGEKHGIGLAAKVRRIK